MAIELQHMAHWYEEYYFRTYRGAPYERSTKWLAAFGGVAEGLIRETGARSVLDAGCAMGFLVEALRDRGVEAYGIDISRHALDAVRDDIKPFCREGSIVEPIEGRFDLVVCQEVLEHIPAHGAEAAVGHLCAVTDDIIFSSTPDGYAEDTHVNVQPFDSWAELFAKHGFIRDLDFDGSAFLPPWAGRFRRNHDPAHRVTKAYERHMWRLSEEVRALRARALETAALLASQEHELRARADVAQLEQTIVEQQEQIEALTERIQFMSHHEHELRRMLLDSQQLLIERDAALQPLQQLVAERTSWAERVAAENEAARQTVRDLQALVDERTAWARSAVAELETCRRVAEERQALVEERTAWAQRAVAELEAIRQRD
jgi:SAM-dependent methyltransferase